MTMIAPFTKPAAGPDRDAALAQYRQRAPIYDLELAPFEPIRRMAVERLALQAGAVVLDVGCGTGLSLQRLQQGVGPQGRVIGIEQCPEMIDRARQRVAAAGWANVRLLCVPAQSARIGLQADAALFHFTHDILRLPEAVDRVMRSLVPAARVVASGLQWAPSWNLAANLFVWGAALHSTTTLDRLDQPWCLLEPWLRELRVEPVLLGGCYVASGRVVGRPSRSRGSRAPSGGKAGAA